MAIDNGVYQGETFLKVKPTDRSRLIEISKKASEKLTKEYNKLEKKEVLTPKETIRFLQLIGKIKEVDMAANLPKEDYIGTDHFWTLTFDEGGYILITVPNFKNDVIIMNKFKTLDQVFAEYRSLNDIILNSTFVGKKLNADYGANAYILYDFNDMLLGIGLDEEGIPIGPLLARKNGIKNISYIDESIPELNDPQIIYSYVRALKNRGN